MEKDKKVQNKVIQTYAEDMATVIENDTSGGLIKKILQGEEEYEKEKNNLSPQSKKNKFFMFVGFLFILLGLGTLIYFISGRVVPTVPVEKQFTPLIFNDKTTFIEVKDFTKDQITQSVLNEINKTEVKSGGVAGIYLTSDKKMMGLRQFLTLIKGNLFASDNLFINDNFMMGVANIETRDFFILLKVRSTADIFDSLRAWEPKMFFDLRGFLGIDLTADTKYLLTKEFQNGIVENKNARVLYDKDNQIVLMYVLADDTSVIISNTEKATNEIMLRLASSQIKK